MSLVRPRANGVRYEGDASIKEVRRQKAININYPSDSKVLRTEEFYLSPWTHSPATQSYPELSGLGNKYQNNPAESFRLRFQWDSEAPGLINCNEWRICLGTWTGWKSDFLTQFLTLPSTQTRQRLAWCVEVGRFFVANIIHAIVEAEVIHFFYFPKKFLSHKEVTADYPIYKISLGVKANKKIIQDYTLHKFFRIHMIF